MQTPVCALAHHMYRSVYFHLQTRWTAQTSRLLIRSTKKYVRLTPLSLRLLKNNEHKFHSLFMHIYTVLLYISSCLNDVHASQLNSWDALLFSLNMFPNSQLIPEGVCVNATTVTSCFYQTTGQDVVSKVFPPIPALRSSPPSFISSFSASPQWVMSLGITDSTLSTIPSLLHFL